MNVDYERFCHLQTAFNVSRITSLAYALQNDILIADGNTRCTTNLSAFGAVQENDVIVMTCSIAYSGNWAPVMRWFNSSHNFTHENVTFVTSDTTVTSQLTVAASAGLHGTRIPCVTYFIQPSATLPTTATNVPSYTYSWTSPTFNIQCK